VQIGIIAEEGEVQITVAISPEPCPRRPEKLLSDTFARSTFASLAALNHSDQLLDGSFSFGHNLGIQYPG
jgi:hypothetical protein